MKPTPARPEPRETRAAAERPREACRVWQLMTELAPFMRAHWAALAAEFDLTPAQGNALRRLEPGKPVPMSSLADGLACDASNITGIVDKLEARGLIERQAAPGDRRVKMLTVTAQGAELRRRFLARSSEPPAAIAGIAMDELRRLGDILGKLVERYALGWDARKERDEPRLNRADRK